jgi:hypothetical protein
VKIYEKGWLPLHIGGFSSEFLHFLSLAFSSFARPQLLHIRVRRVLRMALGTDKNCHIFRKRNTCFRMRRQKTRSEMFGKILILEIS